jgi:hypothetical protein
MGFREADLLEKSVENYFLLMKDVSRNWQYLPKDLVSKEFQVNNKFGKTESITNKIIDILNGFS